MKELLKELPASGTLDAYSGDETHLPAILGGIHLLRKGALATAMRPLGTASRWGADELALFRGLVPPEKLLLFYSPHDANAIVVFNAQGDPAGSAGHRRLHARRWG